MASYPTMGKKRKSYLLKAVILVNFEIRIVFTPLRRQNLFAKITDEMQLMSVKKQIPNWGKLYSIYEEKPVECLDKIDVDSYFYLNVYDVPQSQHQMVRVSEGFNSFFFAIQLFHFFRFEYTAALYPPGTSENFQEKTQFSGGRFARVFLKTFDKASKCIQITSAKPKIEIGPTKWKGNLFTHFYKDITEHLNRQIGLLFWFANNNSSVSSIKNSERDGNQFKHTEIVKLDRPEIYHLYRNRYYVAKFGKNWEHLRCVANSPLIVEMAIALLNLVGMCIVWPKTMCSGIHCIQKRRFKLSGEVTIKFLNARPRVRLAIFPMENK